MTKPSATIIGAGIVGMSAAAFLQREGHDVTVVDRVGPGEGCSFGNAGGLAFAEIVPTVHPNMLTKIPGWLMNPLGPLTIRWSYFPKALPWFMAMARNAMPDRVKAITEARAALALRVISDFETLLKPAGGADLIRYQDTLRIYDDEKQFAGDAPERAVKNAYGFETKTFSGDEAREMEPALGPLVKRAAFHGGWYFVTNPERVVKTIAAEVVRQGGRIVADDVVALERDGHRVTAVQLKAGGRMAVDKLVICAGAYSHLLGKMLGEKFLLEASAAITWCCRILASLSRARSPMRGHQERRRRWRWDCVSPARMNSQGSMPRRTTSGRMRCGPISSASCRDSASLMLRRRAGWDVGQARRIHCP